MSDGGEWLTSEQAAAALAVRLSTLYAYVSRGVVTSLSARDASGRRVSLFARSDIMLLAKQRARPHAGTLSVQIESDVSELNASGSLFVRGRPIADLATSSSFEEAARHVLGTNQPWPVVRRPELPHFERRTDCIRAATLFAASQDPHRIRLDADHCCRVAMEAVAVACAALDADPDVAVTSTAARLALILGKRSDANLIRCIDVALIVLIDHELTASTLATRAAAGVGADPWMAILAGQCAISGSAQAGASGGAVKLLRRWSLDRGTTPLEGPLWGFGHHIYKGPDPRFDVLLAEVAQIDSDIVKSVNELCLYVARMHSLHPNVDLALAALMIATGMSLDSGEVLFTIGRTIGLACHAIEEYPHGLRLRPRAISARTQLP